MWSYLKFLHVVWRYSQPWMSLAANKLQIPFVMNTSSHRRMYICTHRALISDIHTHLRLLSWWFMRLIWLETEKSWLIIQTWMSERLKVDQTSRLTGMSLFAFQISAVSLFREPPFDLRRRRMQAGGGKLKLIKHGRWGNLGLILVVWQEEPTNQVFYSILLGKFRVWCCNLHIELFPRSAHMQGLLESNEPQSLCRVQHDSQHRLSQARQWRQQSQGRFCDDVRTSTPQS